ncbi:interferon phi 1 isoform X1 [Alosa alosa]|uniref:interferon phi 1 isoform X1 n=1 Tax=Alosa alosa TaxID=278164 RepID=UPI0020150551|nr:interferon phi 1 isoform X1 [Alosa alosa]
MSFNVPLLDWFFYFTTKCKISSLWAIHIRKRVAREDEKMEDKKRGEEGLLLHKGGDFKSDGVPRLPDTQILSALYRSVNSATADDKIIFLHVATKQIVRLLNNSNVTNTWDKTKLDNLLNVLNQQSTNLGDCAAQVPTRMSKYRKQLKKHFRSLKKFLIEMKYSKQSWEQIRKEVERHLHRLLYLANTMVEY